MIKNFFKIAKKSFTLVELIIVVVIIWILAAALLPRLQWAQSKARDTARQAWLKELGTALVSYYNEKWFYPWNSSWCADNLWSWFLVPWFLKSIPQDPQTTRKILFWSWCNTPASYWVLPIYRGWLLSWWIILAADTESEWKSSNYVLTNNWNNVRNTDSTQSFSAIGCDWTSTAKLWCFQPNIEWSTLDSTICRDWVNINWAINWTWCSDTVKVWTAKINEAMIYILTQ